MNLSDLLADKPVEAAIDAYNKEMNQPMALERMYEVDAVAHILREGTCIREALRAAWEAAELAQEQSRPADTGAKAESEVLDSSCAGKGIRRFTMYRRNVPLETHDENQRNAPDEPAFEGVVFSDGSVALRWCTAVKSTSVWASMDDALKIHGHPEYRSELVWHDPAAGESAMREALEKIASLSKTDGEDTAAGHWFCALDIARAALHPAPTTPEKESTV
jgi:hypothetical protein